MCSKGHQRAAAVSAALDRVHLATPSITPRLNAGMKVKLLSNVGCAEKAPSAHAASLREHDGKVANKHWLRGLPRRGNDRLWTECI